MAIIARTHFRKLVVISALVLILLGQILSGGLREGAGRTGTVAERMR